MSGFGQQLQYMELQARIADTLQETLCIAVILTEHVCNASGIYAS